MLPHEGARVTDLASIVSVEPSQYYVGGTPVASNVIAWFLDETRPHDNVLMTRQQTITTGTLISRVEGAPAGGIGRHSSGAAGGPCKFLRHGGERGQVSVRINGQEVVADGDWYDMDCGPNGGNVVGLVTYVVAVGPREYVNTETGERIQVGQAEPVADTGAEPNAPGIGVVGPAAKFAAGVYEAMIPPMWEGVKGLGDGLLYVATHTKQDWWNDGAPLVANAGAAIADAVTHPRDTLWSAYEMGMSAVSGQVEAFHVDPATTTGNWVGNALNAYMIAKDSIAAYNAFREWRAARAAEALADARREAERLARAEREAAEALAEAERLARAEREARAAAAFAEAQEKAREAEALAEAQEKAREAKALAEAQEKAREARKMQALANKAKLDLAKELEARERAARERKGVTVTKEQSGPTVSSAAASINQRVADAYGLTEDTILYRYNDTQYLGWNTVEANPSSTGHVMDVHGVRGDPGAIMQASEVGPGLNFSRVPGEFYRAPYASLISVKWGDVKDSVRIFPNTSAKAEGAFYLQFPEDYDLPVTIVEKSAMEKAGIPRHHCRTDYRGPSR